MEGWETVSVQENTMKHAFLAEYARMWPREIFDRLDANTSGKGKKLMARGLEVLNKPGVYVLYRDEKPHYIGQATKLYARLWQHANRPGSRYYNFWNFFSAFVVEETTHRNELEGILIAAMPTANSANPRLLKRRFPKEVSAMLREIRRERVKAK
jgi:hypothetical protein